MTEAQIKQWAEQQSMAEKKLGAAWIIVAVVGLCLALGAYF